MSRYSNTTSPDWVVDESYTKCHTWAMVSVVVSVRLDQRLVRAIDAVGRERSEVVREALEEWLRRRRVSEMVREHREGYRRTPADPGDLDWLVQASVWPEEPDQAAPSKARGPARVGANQRPRKRKRGGDG